jgi:glycosyltransferase involved in cell wall biosynthesis
MSNNPDTYPLVSVILPVYNAEKLIQESLLSILNQTYTNIECIVIDDASTDNTLNIIKNIKDERITLVEKPINTGYTKSLNIGIEKATGKYIARMDADDFSYPERIAKQVSFMEKCQEYIMCCTHFALYHNNYVIPSPDSFERLKIELLFTNVICHPSIMMRSSSLKTHQLRYEHAYEPSEDYKLWTRLIEYGKIGIIPETLIKYRIHQEQVSSKRNEQQAKIAKTIRVEYANQLFKIFKGHWMIRLTPFWFAFIILIESIFNRKINTYLALRKVIRKRHKIFSH